MLELSMDRALQEHRKLWNWIADQYERGYSVSKFDYFTKHNMELVMNHCFCCEYARLQATEIYGDEGGRLYVNFCQYCPVKWCEDLNGSDPYAQKTCFCEHSLYEAFENYVTEDDDEMAEWARIIAELPENKSERERINLKEDK